MDHDARKTVGNGKRHDTQVVPYGAIPGICITKRERHIGRSLRLCPVGNGKRHDTQVVPYGAIPILRRGFCAFLQVKGRFWHTSSAIPKLT